MQISKPKGSNSIFLLVDIAANGLRDQDRLDGANNCVIWNTRISCLLDEHDLKTYIDSVVVVPTDADLLKKYKKEMAKVKRLILDGVQGHVVSHILGKARQMWEALATLYEGSFEQRKMYLEEKLRCMRMQKGERIYSFLTRL